MSNNKTMQNIIFAALFTPTRSGWGLPVHFWGEPGVGKSAIQKALYRRIIDFPFEVLSPGQRGEGAFGVTPVLSADRSYLEYPHPDWVAKFDNFNQGVVFIDEANTAPPALQPALLGLFLDKFIGGKTLGPKVRMMMAANPTDIGAGTYDYPLPVANRTGHIDWMMPTIDEWAEWVFSSDIDNEEEATISADEMEDMVMADWGVHWAKARGLVTGFLRANSTQLHKMPDPNHPQASRAWPSHRTWEMSMRAIASAGVHKLTPNERNIFAGSFVGEGAFSELVNYEREADLPDPRDVLDGKVKFDHNSKRIDRTYAVLGSCAALITPESCVNRKERAEVLISLMTEVSKTAMDIVYPAAMALSQAGFAKLNKESKELFRGFVPFASDALYSRAV